MVDVPQGYFLMGTQDEDGFPSDGEGPVREVWVDSFQIARYAVSNEEFSVFVESTGYRTEAELIGWSYVFFGLLPDDTESTRKVPGSPWWRHVNGADWRHPYGPQSDLTDLGNHPAVHVSWNDAIAYCAWAGVRLPTEAEWEKSARGGLVQKRYAWGDELSPGDIIMCNTFQGTFPTDNTLQDGYAATAPVDAFPPNGYGLHNAAGNVWEWCADWFSATHHGHGSRTNPHGPGEGSAKVIRGGSYLCHDSYCNRYRVAARSFNTPDSSTGNMGFRVATGRK